MNLQTSRTCNIERFTSAFSCIVAWRVACCAWCLVHACYQDHAPPFKKTYASHGGVGVKKRAPLALAHACRCRVPPNTKGKPNAWWAMGVSSTRLAPDTTPLRGSFLCVQVGQAQKKKEKEVSIRSKTVQTTCRHARLFGVYLGDIPLLFLIPYFSASRTASAGLGAAVKTVARYAMARLSAALPVPSSPAPQADLRGRAVGRTLVGAGVGRGWGVSEGFGLGCGAGRALGAF